MTDYTLYNDDCLRILPTIEAGIVDAVITDFPYSQITHDGARSTDYQQQRIGIKQSGIKTIDFAYSDIEFIRDALSLAKPKRWSISFVDWHHAYLIEQSPPEGLEFIRLGVWVKHNPMPQLTGDRPGTGWESIVILHPHGNKKWNGGGRSGVWQNGTTRYGYFGPSNHPTEKPLSLMKKLILDFTDRGETILDCCMGSGTTGVAALQLGRKFIGIEIDPHYFAIAEKRIEQADRQQPLFPSAGSGQDAEPDSGREFDRLTHRGGEQLRIE